jgi:hypothetical protein
MEQIEALFDGLTQHKLWAYNFPINNSVTCVPAVAQISANIIHITGLDFGLQPELTKYKQEILIHNEDMKGLDSGCQT